MVSKQYSTLIEMLESRAGHCPESVAFTFMGQPCSYARMWESINSFGAFLLGIGVSQGDRVVLVLPNSVEFFAAFYGVQQAGGIAVPLFPGSGPERIFSIAGMCGARTLIVPSTIPAKQLAGFSKMGAERGLRLVTVPESVDSDLQVDFPTVHPEDIAFFQYTSGSTGNPKGVQLSHDNLLTNMVQMISAVSITADDIFVSWLPVYHDMGLILMTMVPFYLGTMVHLLPTNLRDIDPWLRAIQSHRGTLTAAPDFAYCLCLRHTNPDDYDLSSLRLALNAAEPIRVQTIRDFEAAFGLENVMTSGYGLAEATVAVSMWPSGSTPRVDERGFVSIGPPVPDIDIRIVENERILPPGVVGEIAIHSPANSRGYLDNPEETDRLYTDDGYLLSGDLGYLDDEGYLFFTSRKKNTIKRAGETISPQELEEIVDGEPAVRYSAAVGVDKGRIEGEQVYVFAEIRDGEIKTENELYDLAMEIVISIYDRMGFHPGRVYLVKPRTIPLTQNGKIQHVRLKDAHLAGELQSSKAVLFPDY